MLVLLGLGHWCTPELVAARGEEQLGSEEVMGSGGGVGCGAGVKARRSSSGDGVHVVARVRQLPFFCSLVHPYSNRCSGIQFLIFL